MARDNSEFIVKVETNIGTVGFIQTSRKNRPKIRKPYEYELTPAKTNKLNDVLKKYLKCYDNGMLQCVLVEKKGLMHGIRLHIFLLGYKPGLCGTPEGITKEGWEKVTKDVQDILNKYLGPEAKAYIEEFSEKDKFQFRFETYILTR